MSSVLLWGILPLLIVLNLYVFIRGWQAVPENTFIRCIYALIITLAMLSLFLGLFLPDRLPERLANILKVIGAFWVICFTFFLISALLADLLRILDQYLNIFPTWIKDHYSKAKLIYLLLVILFLSAFSVIGFIKYADPKVVKLDLVVNKKTTDLYNLSVVAASDFHIGNIVKKKRLEKWINLINAQKPDVILLVGDLFDRNFNKYQSREIADDLMKLKAKYGIYAVLGNHEYDTDTSEVVNCMKLSGIILLRDQTVALDNKVLLIGRDDISNSKRKKLSTILPYHEQSLPTILMDHQPACLHESIINNIDLHISGHLHNGQFFPYILLFSKEWKLKYGYYKIAGTHFYISSGIGLRRIPIRFGSQSEIVLMNLRTNGNIIPKN